MFRIYYDFEYENNFDHPITLYYFIFDEHIYTNPTTIKKSMLFSNPTSLKINNPRGYQVYVRTDFNHNIPDIITKSKEFYLPNILFVYFKYLEADQTYLTMEKVETFPSTIHIPATGSYLIKIGQESKEITFPDHSSVYIRRNDVSTSYQVVNNDISSLNFPAGTSDNDCVELVIMAETNEYRNLYIDAVENPNNYNIVCYRKIGESVFNSIGCPKVRLAQRSI
ncbi:hypothetical protein TVAG_311810 [Trichomonas vaginalis G3]|uniref:Uncharacterized protein n=1 Tax=Trichomonas vaginalis (strain ATCC PRA-98 / G3) TaxID=412133 RepID=A2EJY7_TRIV3|nr:hypothetical protein TVAG_311810 [Trichomonas vaginalis G3]|eukprot:XP_001319278.1 hypothetical protein [Trichomonas vaginalis G3]